MTLRNYAEELLGVTFLLSPYSCAVPQPLLPFTVFIFHTQPLPILLFLHSLTRMSMCVLVFFSLSYSDEHF